jgi:hypothetical protein
MTMRDEIVGIIEDGLDDGLDLHDVADAIIAALPGMIPELVWIDSPTFGYMNHDTQMSGQYWVGRIGRLWVVTGHRSFTGLSYPTREAAKAAANAHRRAAMCKAMGWAE